MVTEEIRKWLERPPATRGIRAVEEMFVIGTDIGKSRDENQDRVAVLKIGAAHRNKTSWCACVCDGMGGMKDGGQAASLALAAFFSSLISNRRVEPEHRLRTAARHANEEVARNVIGGGATLSGVLFEEGSTFTINVGDSRIYQLTDSGEVQRLTVDDTLAEAFGAEDRGLLQYIGSKSRISPHVSQLLQRAGQLVITSDGAHVVGDLLLNNLSRNANNAQEYCERILDVANWLGGRDNASLIAIPPHAAAASRTIETSSDISVWSVEGRLKITWAAGKPDLLDASVPQAQAQAPEKSDKPVEQATSSKNPGVLAPRKKRPTKSKKEQIEIGFSDERTK